MSAGHLTKSECTVSAGSQPWLVTEGPAGGVSPISLASSPVPASHGLSLVFMFPGGGAQYPAMGKDLYHSEPAFHAEIDGCAALARKYLSIDLWEALLDENSSAEAMKRPSIALPALFAVEYSLAKLWMSLGVKPDAMIGHSLGEYVAACLSGVFCLQHAIRVVGLRGVLFEKVGMGAMLSVPLPADVIKGLLGDRLSLAAVNAPNLCVVSGLCPDIDRLEAELNAMNVESQRIPLAVPAHSYLLNGVCEEFFQSLRQVPMQKPGMRFISNVTGNWISDAEARDPAYWVCHLRNTVQFAAGMNLILRNDPQVLLEVGPGRILSSLAKLNMCSRLILPSMRRRGEPLGDMDVFRSSLGRLAQSGLNTSTACPEVRGTTQCASRLSLRLGPKHAHD